MTALLRAEIVKLLSTRGWIVLLVGALTLMLANLAIAAVFAGWAPQGVSEPVPGLDTHPGLHSLFASVAGGTVFAVLLGTLGMTTEYRHRTIATTYLAAPRRSRVILAKLLAYLVAGAALGVVVDVVCLAVAEVVLELTAAPVSPLRPDVIGILGGAILSYALHAVVGVGVGSLVRHQVAAVVVVLVWTQAVEGAVVALVPGVGRWLLTGAASAVVRYGESTGLVLLPAWAGALLLVGYGAAFAVAACATTVRRDAT